jgi:branched-subunit amino acid transport protein AzlD
MEPTTYLLAVIPVAAAATFLTRALPFCLLYRVADHPLLNYLGRYLPPMLMVLLLLYSFKNEVMLDLGILHELSALTAVLILHLSLRNPLLSILGGTGLYMLIVQLGFFG